MKIWGWMLTALCLLGTVACQPNARPDDGYDESLYQDGNRGYGYVTNRRPQGTNANPLGYSRQRGNEFRNATDGGALPGPDVYIDRNSLARQIAYLSTKLPDVSDAAVLVTASHVFIGVEGNNGARPSQKALYETRRTALSLTPRYYQVYVSGKPGFKKRLQEIGAKAMGTREKLTLTTQEINGLMQDLDQPPLRVRKKDPLKKVQ
jgi:hypothetical protein